MKLQKWLIFSALVVGASAQAAEEPAAQTVDTAKVSVLQKAEEAAQKAGDAARKALAATKDVANEAMEAMQKWM